MNKIIRIGIGILFFFCSISLFAGDLSYFELIGFNAATTHVAFSEYGIDTSSRPYASVFVVDIKNNSFESGGVFTHTYPKSTSLEDNERGAFIAQLLRAHSSLTRYNIDPLNKGRLIYVLLNGDEPGNTFTFTDHTSDIEYSVELVQTISGVGSSAKGAFYINLQVSEAHVSSSYTIGNKYYYRQGVVHYKIRSIYTSKQNDALVFVVEKLMFNSSDESNIRFMVETVSLL